MEGLDGFEGGEQGCGLVMRKRVMVVVDNSSHSRHAMIWALTHVANKGDLLTLLHVVPPSNDRDRASSDHSSSSSSLSSMTGTTHLANSLGSLYNPENMSGVSLADRHTAAAAVSTSASKPNKVRQQPMMGGVMGSLRVIELQLVAFIMVFSASGLVPLLDLVFPAFVTAYLIALSRLCFPANSASSEEIIRGGRLFQMYVLVGTTVGLFLPLAYVLGGFARGDDHAVRSATPHLFLLSFQILTENVISGLGLFSAPVRALVPVLYTVRRIFVVIDWVSDVWVNKTLPAIAPLKDVSWLWFGRSLAVANLVYFSINLFCFLIPQFLPHAFEKYFKERDEVRGKMAEDKRPVVGLKPCAAEAKQNSYKKAD